MNSVNPSPGKSPTGPSVGETPWGPAPKIATREHLWDATSAVLSWASGEFYLARRPNSGTVVLIRTLWVTGLLTLAALGARERLAHGATWQLAWPHREIMMQLVPWVGAIFGATYAGLYARFASQWTYLAGLYNQIMAVAAQTDSKIHSNRDDVLAAWRAGFIEDAEDVHLARRPLYAGVILSFAQKPGVRSAYAEFTAGGAERLARLEEQCRLALAKEHIRRQDGDL
jgi:hypothetical protein